MDQTQFDLIVEKRCTLIKQILASKAEEYARGDRLHNFKRAAQFGTDVPEKACWNFLMKHLVSIADLVDDLNQDHAPRNLLALSKEKLGDAINYLILLEALIEERVESKAVSV